MQLSWGLKKHSEALEYSFSQYIFKDQNERLKQKFYAFKKIQHQNVKQEKVSVVSLESSFSNRLYLLG